MGKMGASLQNSPWKRPEERDQEHEAKRLAVLTTAAELFATHGFHRTTLTEVATRLNITKPAIYHYFTSKDSILIECIQLAIEASEKFFAERGNDIGTGRERLRRFMVWYAENMTAPFGRCLVRIAEQDVGPEAQKQLLAAKRLAYRRLRQMIEAGVEDRSIPKCDTNAAALTIAGAVSWLGHWYRAGGRLPPNEAAELVTDLLLEGLAPSQDTKDLPRAPRKR